MTEKEQSQAPGTLKDAVKKVKSNVGREELTDDDILILAAESIIHTYTFEEKGYSRDLQ